MRTCKIGIIGHFGCGKELANGQTIKTKIIAKALEELYPNQVKCLDTHGGIIKLPKILLGCVKLLATCDNIIILVAIRGVKVIPAWLVFLNFIFYKRIHFSIVGGWLPEFLSTHNYP